MSSNNIFTLSNKLNKSPTISAVFNFTHRYKKINSSFKNLPLNTYSLEFLHYDYINKLNSFEVNQLEFKNFIKLKKKHNYNFLKIKIFLIKTPIIKRALRFQILQYKPQYVNYKFFFFKKYTNKFKNFYQHTFTKKQLLSPIFNFNTVFFKQFFYCIAINKIFKKFVSIYKNNLGIIKVLPLIDCIKINDKINFYKNIIKFMYFVYIGSIMQLKYYKIFFLLSNIGLIKPKFAVSMGTYVIILKKKNKKILLKLPSNQNIWISKYYYGIIGRNSGAFHYKEYFGKFSTNFGNNKIIVRSVAKNPIDHPNGGRTRGKIVFRTPWGLIAKSSK